MEFEWDTEDAPDARAHTVTSVVSACDAHAQHTDDTALYEDVLQENQRKNIVIQKIIENTDLSETKVDTNGNETAQLKKGKEYVWEFDGKRNLVIDIKGATIEEKAAVQAVVEEHLADEINKIILA